MTTPPPAPPPSVNVAASSFKAQLEKLKDKGRVVTLGSGIHGSLVAIGQDYVVIRGWVPAQGTADPGYEIDQFVPFSAIACFTVRVPE